MLVISVLNGKPGATLLQLVDATELDKRTITHLLDTARDQAGVEWMKEDSRYWLTKIGPVFKKSGIDLAATGELGLRPKGSRRV